MIVVFSRPGREQMTAATVNALEGTGGASLLPYEAKALFWVGETPPPAVPWRCVVFPQKPGGSVADFWLLLRTFPDVDLVVFEDDVFPCRNAVPYIDRWVAPTTERDVLTSFFNPRGVPVGPRRERECFTYSQAIKIPRALAAQLRNADTSKTGRADHDNVIGMLLLAWGLPVYYHRSLVEHMSMYSVIPRGPRPLTPKDFVGRDFDALA